MLPTTFNLHKEITATIVRNKQERTKQVYSYYDIFTSIYPDLVIGTVGLKMSGKYIVNDKARPVFNSLEIAVKYVAFEFLAKEYLNLSPVV